MASCSSSTIAPPVPPPQLCWSKSGIFAKTVGVSKSNGTNGLMRKGRGRRMRVVRCQASSIPADRVPDMGKRKFMNLLLLGAISLPSGFMIIPYLSFFAPPGNFQKLEHFEGVDIRRWQSKMHFLLRTLNVAYVLNIEISSKVNQDPSTEKMTTEESPKEDATGKISMGDGGKEQGKDKVPREDAEATRQRLKIENDDYICRGCILNGMSDTLFDVYQHVETAKKLWEILEAKYMSEDASSKNFLVSQFMKFKMDDNRKILYQFHEIQRILSNLKQHNLNMDESIIVSSIIDKLPSSWNETKRTLMHQKEAMSLEGLANHLQIEEELRLQDGSKEQYKVHVVQENKGNKNKNKSHNKSSKEIQKPKQVCWKCGKPGNTKRECYQ